MTIEQRGSFEFLLCLFFFSNRTGKKISVCFPLPSFEAHVNTFRVRRHKMVPIRDSTIQ